MDYASNYTEKRQRILELRLRRLYNQTRIELEQDLKQFTDKKENRSKELKKQIDEGKIDEQEYQDWLARQVFKEKQWQTKINDLTEKLQYANEQALGYVRHEQVSVFSENANYQAYELENDTKSAYSFDIYDEITVQKLLDEQPNLLPKRKIDKTKDQKWNRTNISNSVAQSIIKGDSIDKLAKRIATQVSETNKKAMLRYARTAMTAAQNAGRIETLERAVDMGIDVLKEWLATLDSRTRDSHRHLDGQRQKIDKPFRSELGHIRYPGDPTANPADVYNCRCTMIYVYPEYSEYDTDWRQSEYIDGISYQRWKNGKETGEGIVSRRVQEERFDEETRNTLNDYLEKLPRQKARKYSMAIDRADKVFSNTSPSGDALKVSGYFPYPTNKIYYLPDEKDWWVPIHETTHYKDANTKVRITVNGEIVVYNSVSEWMNATYTEEMRKADIEAMWSYLGVKNQADLSDKYVCYYIWRKEAQKNGLTQDDLGNINDIVDMLIKKELPIDNWGTHPEEYLENPLNLFRESVANYTNVDVLQSEYLMKEWEKMMPNLFDITRKGFRKIWKMT